MNSNKTIDKHFVRHELKTPVGVVRGYLSMLKDGDFGKLELTTEQKEIFSRIDKDMLELINKINTLLAD